MILSVDQHRYSPLYPSLAWLLHPCVKDAGCPLDSGGFVTRWDGFTGCPRFKGGALLEP